ncbi:hypothetical protein BJF78_30450 [Pseudonocardia sp. CNS-139]|nr:hypothetical protein BJF78_30450 [Pseudonocardia sp. CNS-139]
MAQAEPRPENRAVINFGDVYCDLAVHDVHSSVRGDVSSHSTVHCYSSTRGGPRYQVEKITMTTRIVVFHPALISREELDTCRGSRDVRDRFEFPCHVPWGRAGIYTAITEAQVAHKGRTLTAIARNMQALEAPTVYA